VSRGSWDGIAVAITSSRRHRCAAPYPRWVVVPRRADRARSRPRRHASQRVAVVGFHSPGRDDAAWQLTGPTGHAIRSRTWTWACPLDHRHSPLTNSVSRRPHGVGSRTAQPGCRTHDPGLTLSEKSRPGGGPVTTALPRDTRESRQVVQRYCERGHVDINFRSRSRFRTVAPQASPTRLTWGATRISARGGTHSPAAHH
jgi:hypothetical protein